MRGNTLFAISCIEKCYNGSENNTSGKWKEELGEHLDIRIKNTYNYSMTVREILKLLRKDGWFKYEQNGSHIQLKHPNKKGRVTVSSHRGDLKKGTVISILKQAGIEIE